MLIELTFLNDGLDSPKKPETESGFWWCGYPMGKVQVDYACPDGKDLMF
jgi:hypothetical protein